eukprot:UN19191
MKFCLRHDTEYKIRHFKIMKNVEKIGPTKFQHGKKILSN